MISLVNPEAHIIQVNISIPPGERSHELQLPVWNALYQVRDFSQYINWIHAESPLHHALQITQLNKSRWKLEDAMQGALVSYEMFIDDPDPYGAQLDSHHAFFNLAEVLIYADDLRSAPVDVEFRDVPSQWKIATSLRPQTNPYAAESYDRLVDSPVEISAFAEQSFNAPCGRYRIVFDRKPNSSRGEPPDSTATLAAMVPLLKRIISSASEWMNDCPFDRYTFIYHASNSPGGGGMEHSYSTAITLPSIDFDNVSGRLMAFTSHEFFHLWDVKRIRPQSLEPVDYTRENYTTALWFSEGVDSTVAEYILLHAGLLDEQHYLNHLSEEITALESRPAHSTQSVEQSSLDAWLEKYPYYGLPDRSISYYNKGELLGVLLDLAMRDSSNDGESLRTLFRWMNEHYAKQGKFFADSEAIREAAETLSHASLSEFFRNYVSGTEEIPWDKFFSRVGLQVVHEEVWLADPGFEAVQKFDRPPVVVEVVPGSSAERAGIKAADTIVQVNGNAVGRDFNQVIAQLSPGETLRLSVRREDGEHTLQWKLAGRKQIVFQLRDVPGITSEQRLHRAAWLFDKSKSHAEAKGAPVTATSPQ